MINSFLTASREVEREEREGEKGGVRVSWYL